MLFFVYFVGVFLLYKSPLPNHKIQKKKALRGQAPKTRKNKTLRPFPQIKTENTHKYNNSNIF